MHISSLVWLLAVLLILRCVEGFAEPSAPYATQPDTHYASDPDLLSDPLLVIPVNETLLERRRRATAFHTQSSHADYVSHVEQLDHQTRVFWPSMREKIRQVVPESGRFTVIDFGGAGGSLAAHIISEWPLAHATVVDIDHTLLSLGARKHANLVRKGALKFVHGDASESIDALSPESADLVVSQFVFQHLYKPRSALEQVVRVLKPDGWLIVLDADTSIADAVYPTPPTVELIEEMNVLRSDIHPAGLVSGRLLDWFVQLLRGYDFSKVQVAPHFSSSLDLGPTSFLSLLSPIQYFALVRYGRVSLAEFNRTASAFEAYVQNYVNTEPRAFVMTSAAIMWTGQRSNSDLGSILNRGRHAAERIPALVDFESRIQAQESAELNELDVDLEAKLEPEADDNLDPDPDDTESLKTMYPSPQLQYEFELRRARETLTGRTPAQSSEPDNLKTTSESSSSRREEL